MTLGPALIVLSLFRQARNALTRAIVTIGRVPFLLYIAHLFALHAIAVVLALATTGDAGWLFGHGSHAKSRRVTASDYRRSTRCGSQS